MRKEDCPKIHKIDTEILKNVIEICDRHNIPYFMMYGSLIGTVRHGGPIPWDCDVDIGMTRESYMKFLKVAPGELDPRNHINIMGSGSTSFLSELKIGRKGTWVYLEGTRDMDIMKQIQLDVFLFDYIKPMSAKKTKLYTMIRKILYMSKFNWDEKRLIMKIHENRSLLNRIGTTCVLVLLHAIRMLLSEHGIERLLYNMFVDKTGTSGRMGLVHDGGKLMTWPEEYFHNLTKMDYDGLSVSVPAAYDQILTDIYGDYMQFPPEDHRYRRNLDRFVLEINE